MAPKIWGLDRVFFEICYLGVKIVKTFHFTKKILLFLEFFMNICHNSGRLLFPFACHTANDFSAPRISCLGINMSYGSGGNNGSLAIMDSTS